MNVNVFVFLFLASSVLLSGCLQSAPATGLNQTGSNQTTESNASNGTPFSNVSASFPTPESPRVGAAALCQVASVGQVELFLIDPTRYAYELTQNGSTTLQMLYSNDSLFLRFSQSATPGCEWIYLTSSDLESVNELAGVPLLTHAELVSRLSSDSCKTVPLMEQVFTIPPNACAFRDVVLRSQAS